MLDSFLDGEKLRDIYVNYRDKFNSRVSGSSEKVVDAIRQHDYERVAHELMELKLAGDIGEYFFAENKRVLNGILGDFMEETITLVNRTPRNNLNIEGIRPVIENLKRIQRAKQFVFEYLNTPEELDKCITEVKLMFEKRLKQFLVEITDEINRIKESLNQFVLHEIVAKYSNMDIDAYTRNPPKEIFERFKEASNKNPIYDQAKDKIRDNIYDKFEKELEQAKSTLPPTSSISYMKRIESALRCLPEDMKNYLQQKVELYKEKINQIAEEIENDLQNAINSRVAKIIKNRFQNYLDSQGMHSFISRSRDLILDQIQDKVNKIDQYFQQDNVNETLAYVKIIYEYKIELETIVPNIREPYSIVLSQIKNKFENAFLCFMDQFLQNNTVEITYEIIINTENSFICLLEFVKLRSESKDQSMLIHMLPGNFDEKLVIFVKETTDYFPKLQEKYEDSLRKIDIASLKNILDIMKKRDSLLRKMKDNVKAYNIKDILVNSMTNAVRKLTDYLDMLKLVNEKIQQLINELIHQPFINDETKRFFPEPNEYYKKLNEKLLILHKVRHLDEHNEHNLHIDVNAEESKCLESIKTKISEMFKITDNLLKQLVSDHTSEQNYNHFNLYHNNLLVNSTRNARNEFRNGCKN
ncbi:unnamed protein product [Didymodactylos carnosus]|uniref:Uncharacterized protein n=1 Tax=Didymodactylos carnosus TaxID=1234261 RepID=A0A8S2WB07_9BILA|nr:unnamed protein product [Didymodactylos carnosus]